jgi:Antitoxin SocA-like, Panacea domain
MEPHNLIKLIQDAPDAIPDEKRERLLGELRAVDSEVCSFERLFEERFGQYAPDEFSGFRKLDSKKLFNVILFFSTGGQLKTKLNKLLFYADFKHFKEYSVSITGARYVHLQYGPVPDDYDYYFAELSREHCLDVVEEDFENYTGFKCIAHVEPDLSAFEQSERNVLEEVINYFRGFGSVEIMKFSHEETAYASTMEGETISYLLAKKLRI